MLRSLGNSLSWLNLVHDKGRLLVSGAGIAFAVLLMFMETGFRNALFDAQVELIQKLDADLIITNKSKVTLLVEESFSRRRLHQAIELEGIQSAYPLYIEHEISAWKNPETSILRPIRVLAFNPEHAIFLDPEISDQAEALKMPDTVLFDTKSRNFYGRCGPGTVAELSRRAVRVVGTFRLGPDFVDDGNVIMSDKNFAKFFPDRRSADARLGRVELGIIKVAPGANILTLQKELRKLLAQDVSILTKQQFSQEETAFWEDTTPIGYVFTLGTAMGFLVGMIICYQILFTDVTNHMPQFGTLKAIGYHNRYLAGVVLQQACLLSLLGFVPGILTSRLLYFLVEGLTGLPMRLNLLRAGSIFFLTISMCIISGLIALRKALSSDPADVFG